MNDPAPAILVAGRIADAGMEILDRAGVQSLSEWHCHGQAS